MASRELTSKQFRNVTADQTRPVNIIKWEHSGVIELLSCSGPITFEGEYYLPGGANLKNIKSGREATIEVFASQTRINECMSGAWKGRKACQIFNIPAVPTDGSAFEAVDGFLQLDGVIENSKLGKDIVTVQILHKGITQFKTPRLSYSELSTLIPPPKTILKYGGSEYVLKAKKQ